MEVYKQSKEYEELMKELQKHEDEDEYKVDKDPDGYFAYDKLLEKKLDLTGFIVKVCSKNTNAPDL